MNAAGPGQLLFSFVRHWSRRAATSGAAERGRLLLATEAVGALTARGAPTTVNAVSAELALDQSGASRMIKDAVEAGYLTMSRAAVDGRRREASVTPAGTVALERAHAWQEEVFAELTVGWSKQRRSDFERAMTDLIARSYDLDAAEPPTPRHA